MNDGERTAVLTQKDREMFEFAPKKKLIFPVLDLISTFCFFFPVYTRFYHAVFLKFENAMDSSTRHSHNLVLCVSEKGFCLK